MARLAALLLVAATLWSSGCMGQDGADRAGRTSTLPWDVVPTLGEGRVGYRWAATYEGSADAAGRSGSFTLELGGVQHHRLLNVEVQVGRWVVHGPFLHQDDGDFNVSSLWAGGLPIALGGEESANLEDEGVRLQNRETAANLLSLVFMPVFVLSPHAPDALPLGWPVEEHAAAVHAQSAGHLLELDAPQGLNRYSFDGSPWPKTVEMIGTTAFPSCCDASGVWTRVEDTFRPTRDEPQPAWPAPWYEPMARLAPVRPVPPLDLGQETWGLSEAMDAARRDPVVDAYADQHPDWFVAYAQTSDNGWSVRLADGEGGNDLAFHIRQTPPSPAGVPLPLSGVSSTTLLQESTLPEPEDNMLVLPAWDSLRLLFIDCPFFGEQPPATPAAEFHMYFTTGHRTNATESSSGLAILHVHAPSPECDDFGTYAIWFGQLSGLIWYVAYTAGPLG